MVLGICTWYLYWYWIIVFVSGALWCTLVLAQGVRSWVDSGAGYGATCYQYNITMARASPCHPYYMIT